jgi:membrane fusion protein (multidrug efflux system)
VDKVYIKDNDFVKKEILFYNWQKRLPTKIEEANAAAMVGAEGNFEVSKSWYW